MVALLTGASCIDFSHGFDTIVSNDEITVVKRDRGAAVARDDLDLVSRPLDHGQDFRS